LFGPLTPNQKLLVFWIVIIQVQFCDFFSPKSSSEQNSNNGRVTNSNLAVIFQAILNEGCDFFSQELSACRQCFSNDRRQARCPVIVFSGHLTQQPSLF
jgi:hypothetical protein